MAYKMLLLMLVVFMAGTFAGIGLMCLMFVARDNDLD